MWNPPGAFKWKIKIEKVEIFGPKWDPGGIVQLDQPGAPQGPGARRRDFDLKNMFKIENMSC